MMKKSSMSEVPVNQVGTSSDDGIKPFDFSQLDEKVTVVAHDREWAGWYDGEILHLQGAFSCSGAAFEHVGSSAVANLYSKPIVDILIGLKTFVIPDGVISALSSLNYEYFGQLHPGQERAFARKRGERSFNLQIVPYASIEWDEKIAFRDFLRAEPSAIARYNDVKLGAMSEGNTMLLAYHQYKAAVVESLLSEALEWHRRVKGLNRSSDEA